ncbi:hypothetical protein [Nitratireductor sp. GCM10026969]|uniref:hypothetical protein n=1 Tax=Nitratireductor sp. GCM10026969 TaxID=3252645 RepID=UPI0036069F82
MVDFAVMTTREMADYIKTVWSSEHVIKKRGRRPVQGIRSVNSTDLPEKLNRLINQILASEEVFDLPGLPGESNTTLASEVPGKMRSYHGNIDGWLPDADYTKMTTKGRKYAAYISEFKGQPNNLKGKSGGGTGQTGYIEYTAVGWRQAGQHGRLVYNYYEDKMYLTFHYQTEWFGKGENVFVLINWQLGLGKKSPGTTSAKAAHVWALNSVDG